MPPSSVFKENRVIIIFYAFSHSAATMEDTSTWLTEYEDGEEEEEELLLLAVALNSNKRRKWVHEINLFVLSL